MTSPAKFKKDKEIIAEYDTQVKGMGFEKPHDACALCTIEACISTRICRVFISLGGAGEGRPTPEVAS